MVGINDFNMIGVHDFNMVGMNYFNMIGVNYFSMVDVNDFNIVRINQSLHGGSIISMVKPHKFPTMILNNLSNHQELKMIQLKTYGYN